MEKIVEDAIKVLIAQVKKNTDAANSLRYTQAALNLAHTLLTFTNAKKS